MSLQLITVADSISKIVVSGLTIKDVDEIPQGLTQRDCPILIPDPSNYVSNFKITINSMGTGTGRKLTISYDLNYILVYGVVGAGRTSAMEAYSGMVDIACDFCDAVYALDTLSGAVNFDATIDSPSLITIGTTQFHSIGIIVPISEFVN